VDVPVQFFQSVIGVEIAIAGALLFQIRFFEPTRVAEGRGGVPGPWLRLVVAVILGATVFGSLYAIATGGQRFEAMAVTLGLALSVLPILLRVLPPVTSSRLDMAVTILGLGLYAAVVMAVIALLNE
jgi:hypothetical protein